MDYNKCDIREYWKKILANCASGEFYSRSLEGAFEYSSSVTNVCPTEFIEYTCRNTLSDPELRELEKKLVSVVTSDFHISWLSRFTRELIRVSLLYVSADEAFSLLQFLRIKASEESSRFMPTDSPTYQDWCLFQLRRFIRNPSEAQVTIFRNFISEGGASFLTTSQFAYLITSFLTEGSATFPRFAIAYLKLDAKSRLDTELLFRCASKLKISQGSFPLSKTREARIRKHSSPSDKDNVTLAILSLPMESTMFDMKQTLPDLLVAVNVPLVSLHLREIRRVFSSRSDGTSSASFVRALGQVLVAYKLLGLIVFQTDNAPVILCLQSDRAAMSSSPDISTFLIATDSRRLIMRLEDVIVLMGEEGGPILSFSSNMDVVTVPPSDTRRLINFEIFIFS